MNEYVSRVNTDAVAQSIPLYLELTGILAQNLFFWSFAWITLVVNHDILPCCQCRQLIYPALGALMLRTRPCEWDCGADRCVAVAFLMPGSPTVAPFDHQSRGQHLCHAPSFDESSGDPQFARRV